MAEQKLTYQSIWGTLSKINVSEHTKAKQGFNYLSWTWAWQTLMTHYPQARVSFREEHEERQGTVMIYATIDIDGFSQEAWLPVMDHKNKAIPYPDQRQRSDAMQRAWVKAAALFGLGLHIYQNEAIPDALLNEEVSDDELQMLRSLFDETDEQAIIDWVGTGMQPGIKDLSSLKSIHFEGLKEKLEKRKAAAEES